MNPLILGTAVWTIFKGIALVLAGGMQLFDFASALLGSGDKQRGAQRLIHLGQSVARLSGKV